MVAWAQQDGAKLLRPSHDSQHLDPGWREGNQAWRMLPYREGASSAREAWHYNWRLDGCSQQCTEIERTAQLSLSHWMDKDLGHGSSKMLITFYSLIRPSEDS